MSVRSSVKSAAERMLLLSGIPAVWRWRRRSDVLVLAYHNIVPRGQTPVGDRSLHLAQGAFAEQLDLLQSAFDVVPLSSVLDDRGGTVRMRHGRVRVVITFDDAYRGAVTAGVAELARRGMPGTIFVPPAYVNGGVFWWDVLTPANADGLPAAERERALRELAGRGECILEQASVPPAVPAALPEHARGASEDDLRRAASTPGITLGSHTWSHPNLAALPPDELREELARPLAWLRERFDAMVPYLSFPYGLSSPDVERAAAAAGYRAALRIEGGWLPRVAANPYALPRLNVPAGISPEGFRLRCAGLLS
jgi:peptidoglycan/xylan/chitin deacetylase (PgdA/CDA1 family)